MRDDRHLLVDERDRPVLHLAGRIAFGVDVGDLLQLQRAFERDRVVDAAAEDTGSRCGCRSAPATSSIGADAFSVCSSSCGSCSSASMCALRIASATACRAPAPSCSAEQIQRDELRRERLGRGDADLRAGVRVDRCRRPRASPCCRRRCRWRGCARPSACASRSAASVSAVSPDCVMTTASVVRRRRSDCGSGTRSRSRLRPGPARAARSGTCRPAPRATTCRRRGSSPCSMRARARASAIFISSRNTWPRVLRDAAEDACRARRVGCSKISLSMKCL